MNISHCNFINNSHYKGHGSAIHYSISDTEFYCSYILFTISYFNEGAESLVYAIENRIINCNNNITFQYCMLCYNQGVSIYTVNHDIAIFN